MKRRSYWLIGAVLAALLMPAVASAATVKTVPWNPSVPGIPHDTISGRTIYLKATASSSDVCSNTGGYRFQWDFGDGTTSALTAVTNCYNIGITHAYTDAVGKPFTAKVYLYEAAFPPPSPPVATGNYFVTIRAQTLQVEVNIAIDQALWYLHRAMTSRSGTGGAIVGRWSGAYAGSGFPGNDAINTQAFLSNGVKPDWDLSNPNPYAETAARGVNYVLGTLAYTGIANRSNPYGTVFTDGNANGIGLYVNSTYPPYQGGMVEDMLVATAMPDHVATYGPANVVGKTFKDIVQDLVDYYAWCQQNTGTYRGGWRYGCQYGSSDNSFNQWAAIGMLAAERHSDPTSDFFSYIDPNMVNNNRDWTIWSHNAAGYFGYTDTSPVWGPFAVTPSGMVQLALQRNGRGNALWDTAESYLRNNWVDTSPYWGNSVLGYYYGLFSFTKAMLLHDNGTTAPGANPLSQLCARDASNNLINCIDWYNSDRSTGDSVNGVARTLVSTQSSDGYWWGHDYDGNQYYFETGWATIMLRKTVFASGLPVAVIDASPTTLANGGTVNFTGKNSFHQDAAKSIVQWDWDFDNNGTFDATGVNQPNIPMTAPPPYPATRTVRLRVTDNSVPPLTADSIINITISSPPFPPTANAGGPYNVCPQAAYLPFYLNGTGSANPDNGMTDGSVGATGDYIKEYAWDLLGNGTYTPMTAQPRVDDFYSTHGLLGSGNTINVGLRVTDDTSHSFPTSGQPDLQGFATVQVYLRLTADLYCTKCVTTAQALTKAPSGTQPGFVQVLWVETGAHHYNIYRGLVNGGPYTMIGTVLNTGVGTGKILSFTDNNITAGATYYYRIAPATLADIETCQSNQANVSATVGRTR